MILEKIIENKEKEVEKAKSDISQAELEKVIVFSAKENHFKANINRSHHINLIAEVKKASPSKGVIRENFNPVEIAQIYQNNGASAISVLTDEKFFQGSLSYLKDIKKTITVPVMRKDFIIDEYQIYETVAANADAILLIADILSERQLMKFASKALELGVEPVVEVYTEEALNKALLTKTNIIGINNRNLSTFEVDTKVTSRMITKIPKDKIVISESGITSYEDVMYLKSIGIKAILVGEALMEANDIGAKVREMTGR